MPIPPPNAKTLVIELWVDLLMQTEGSTVNYVYNEIDLPELEDLGPYIEDM